MLTDKNSMTRCQETLVLDQEEEPLHVDPDMRMGDTNMTTQVIDF